MIADYFAGRLRELREAAGLTQKQLADKAGLHAQAIVKLEAAEYSPTWPTVLALASALGVDCMAFTRAPGARPPVKPGRPPKQKSGAQGTKRP